MHGIVRHPSFWVTVGAIALAVTLSASAAERVTFTKDVLPILQENCQSCHRPVGSNLAGMVAPMSLMTYEEVRPWAKSLVKLVQSKEMPPWHADKSLHTVFKNERTLSDEEIETLVNWVNARAPRGNPKDAPEPIEFSETGWNLGDPDLVIDFPEPFFVADGIEDLYHNLTTQLTDEQLPNDRWIKSIEFKPGSEVVHHIIGYATSYGEDVEASAEEGAITRGMLGGIAPGTDTAEYPEGYGILLPKNAHVTFAMHYHKESGPGTGTWDSSQIGVKFHGEEINVEHPVEMSTLSYGPFEIPPYAERWKVGASRSFSEDTVLLSMLPHLHLRGDEAKYTAYYPDGTSEVLLHVPEYDFNWQTSYDYDINKILPAGTRIEMEFWYDNSKEKAEQIGFNAARAIRFGGPTTDEMDLAWISIAPVEPVAND